MHARSQAKDKGKAKAVDSDSNSQQEWQTSRKKINLRSKPLQSRHWDVDFALPRQSNAASSSQTSLDEPWNIVIQRNIPVYEDANAFATLGDVDAMVETKTCRLFFLGFLCFCFCIYLCYSHMYIPSCLLQLSVLPTTSKASVAVTIGGCFRDMS